MKKLSGFLLVILLLTSLSGCQEIKHLFGIKEKKKDLPSGEYIGLAKKIDENTAATLNGATANPSNGQAASVNVNDGSGVEVKISFLAKDPDMVDGVGVLIINNDSQRFYWRNDGNSENVWNVLFRKDQNIFSNMQNDFKFDGLVTSSEVENKLTGRLHFNYDSQMSDYYVEAYQSFKPEIIPPKAAIEAKAGDPIILDVAKIGEDQDAIEVKLKPNAPAEAASAETAAAPTEASPAPANGATANGANAASAPKDPTITLNIQQIQKDKKGIKLTVATDKALAKGDYTLYILRSGKHKSNTLPIKII